MSTYCNPMNLSYRFQIEGWAKESLREAADPSVVVYNDRYFLFASKSGGFWHSANMRDWTFAPYPAVLPAEDYAPDVRVMDGWLYFTASRNTSNCPVYRTRDPLSNTWELVGEPFIYWDPNFFQDDDGRVYFYWGCACMTPVYGVEIDIATMKPIGETVELLPQEHDVLGWERWGENGCGGHRPWVEGAWMTKHDGRYYLQYAAPGTEFNVYCDGVAVGRSPLGPFEQQPHNPYSQKAGGFITGSGHGSTFADGFGNLWHMTTMRISVKHSFERRLGLFPAAFDKDGVLFCNTNFGDWPTRLPHAQWDADADPFAGWMLLSYGKPAAASAALDGFPPERAFNENIRDYWAAPRDATAPWLQVDLGDPATVAAVQINFAEHLCNQIERKGPPLFHQYMLEGSLDGKTWLTLADKRQSHEDTPHDYTELAAPARVRYVRLTIHHMPAGGVAAVSGLRVFGQGEGKAPAVVTGLTAKRDPADQCSASFTWQPSPGATGYNVRWGIEPDKLYCSWMVLDQNELTFHTLAAAQRDYYVGVEAFNENGVAPIGRNVVKL